MLALCVDALRRWRPLGQALRHLRRRSLAKDVLNVDHGTVCESGTFDELMNTAGAFRDLVAPQQHTVEPMAEV